MVLIRKARTEAHVASVLVLVAWYNWADALCQQFIGPPTSRLPVRRAEDPRKRAAHEPSVRPFCVLPLAILG